MVMQTSSCSYLWNTSCTNNVNISWTLCIAALRYGCNIGYQERDRHLYSVELKAEISETEAYKDLLQGDVLLPLLWSKTWRQCWVWAKHPLEKRAACNEQSCLHDERISCALQDSLYFLLKLHMHGTAWDRNATRNLHSYHTKPIKNCMKENYCPSALCQFC